MSQAVDTDRVKVDDRCWRVQCAECGQWFEATRSDASFCKPAHRKRYFEAPKRKANALHRLQFMVLDAREIKNTYRTSQDVFDQMVILRKALDNIIADFEVPWEQPRLPVDES